jgi:predicted component of type VI protein secretion system
VLAGRRPVKVDVDNLDDVVARLTPSLMLPLTGDGGTVVVNIGAMDDFQPDQLADNLELFEQLCDLRRNLGSRAVLAADSIGRKNRGLPSAGVTRVQQYCAPVRLPHGPPP